MFRIDAAEIHVENCAAGHARQHFLHGGAVIVHGDVVQVHFGVQRRESPPPEREGIFHGSLRTSLLYGTDIVPGKITGGICFFLVF